MLDETMSQDTAFSPENNEEETFKFDEEQVAPEDSQSETAEEEEDESTTSASSEENEVVEEEEQRVPYSRFKRKVDELTETSSKIQFLEERLQELEQSRQEPKEDIQPDAEWIQLYGDSDIAKKAYLVQMERESKIQERAVRQALESISRHQEEEQTRLIENEEVIDENLIALQETVGRKLTSKQEEEILSIVDEFSPVGADGKYLSLFPFDKAYEIYALRNSAKGQSTRQARRSVADLTGNSSEGESDATSEPYKRGWDNWRDQL